MTKEELIQKLKDLHNNFDTEAAHVKADDLIIEFINDEEIKEAYYNVPKWYS